jgi:hypothetical protein
MGSIVQPCLVRTLVVVELLTMELALTAIPDCGTKLNLAAGCSHKAFLPRFYARLKHIWSTAPWPKVFRLRISSAWV